VADCADEYGEGAAPEGEPPISEVRVPCNRTLIGIICSIDPAGLDDYGGGEQTPYTSARRPGSIPTPASAGPRPGANPSPSTCTNTTRAAAPMSFATVLSHNA
jgi:hypothetical protein